MIEGVPAGAEVARRKAVPSHVVRRVLTGAVVAGHLVVVGALAVDLPRTWLWLTLGAVTATAHVALWRASIRAARYTAVNSEAAAEVAAQLGAVVAHELRTPLTAILGYARTLRAHVQTLDPAAAVACADLIERQARRLAALVDDLLIVSDGQAHADDRRSAALDEVLGTVVGELDHDQPGSRERVRLDVEPGLRVAMGPAAAGRALGSLLDNAVKFAVDGSPVAVRARRQGSTVYLEVANVTSAPPLCDRGDLFAPLIVGDASDTRRHGGAGLGLAVVRRLVEDAEGSVRLDVSGDVVTAKVAVPSACTRHAAPAVA